MNATSFPAIKSVITSASLREEETRFKVGVVPLKADRLGQAHACHRDHPEQIMVRPSAQSIFGRQGQRRRQQRIDLFVAVNMGLGAL